MVRAAIIGLGRWGRSLVNSVHNKSDVIRFTRAYTRTRAGAEAFCGEKGIPLAASYEDILADPQIDAVVLATPHSQHEAQVRQAAVAGKHIHVEKPITLNYESAKGAIAAVQDAGLVLAVGFCRRFHPSVGEIRERLADGRLGQVVSIVGRHTTSTGQFIAPENWRAAPEEAPGGALTAVGVHSLDHMIEFAGRVRDVRCVVGRYIPGPSDDTTSVMLHFESGATGLLFCWWQRRPTSRSRCMAPRGSPKSARRTCRASASCRPPTWRRPARLWRRPTRRPSIQDLTC